MSQQEPREPHRSIQDIIPPARSKPIRPPQGPAQMKPSVPPPPPPTPPRPLNMRPNQPKGMTGIVVAIVVILLLGGIAFWVTSTFFHRAYVTVTPKTYTASVESSFESSLETSSETSTLPYRKTTAQETLTKTAPASGSEHVENRASGTITVYNAFSEKSERLITNTRFQTSDGLIYRVHTPINIPGYTMKAGVKVPGALDITVYADEPGEKYNIGLVDFTVPGLKGSQQYELIYAKSKTPMSGGFVGEQAVVDPSVRSAAVEELKANLDRTLRENILENAPAGYLVFADTISITYTEGTDTVQESNAVISVSGTATAPAFLESAFAATLAQAGGVFAEGQLNIDNPNELSVHVNQLDAVGTETPFTVTVAGTARVTAEINTSQLGQDLRGRDKAAVTTVLPGYPGIADIVVQVYPFWRNAIPENIQDVDIQISGTPETAE